MVRRSSGSSSLVLIAETRVILAQGLKALLQGFPGTESVAISTGLESVLDVIERNEVELIIVGVGLQGASPLMQLRRFRQKLPSRKLILLADAADRETILAGLAEGACGVIPITAQEHEILTAVTSVLAGNISIPNTVAQLEQRKPIGASPITHYHREPTLTSRQYEAVSALAQGKTNKQIASLLGISESTVRVHLNAAFHTLGVHDRASAASTLEDYARG